MLKMVMRGQVMMTTTSRMATKSMVMVADLCVFKSPVRRVSRQYFDSVVNDMDARRLGICPLSNPSRIFHSIQKTLSTTRD